jgi:predicted esterase
VTHPGARKSRGLLLVALLWAGAVLSAQDLQLGYRSLVDDTDQPYRLYIPKGYQAARRYPLVVMLHGTTGSQNTFFDDPRYTGRPVKAAADRLAMLVVAPHGRGPREYRGRGEQDVFAAIDEVRRRCNVDPGRIYITGHSMGGTGAAYLALHHPDVFAAAAALAPAYGWPWLAENARHVPFWWIAGALDRPWFHFGTMLGINRMMTLGMPVRQSLLAGKDHYGPLEEMSAVLEWLAQHRRIVRPREYDFVVDTPLHGQAYVTRVDELQRPGEIGRIRYCAVGAHVQIATANIGAFTLLEFPAAPTVSVDGKECFRGAAPQGRELRFRASGGRWSVEIAPLRRRQPSDWRFTPIAQAPQSVSMAGVEAPLANWMTDAMRVAAGADIALMNRVHYRGAAVPAGSVDMVDILDAMPPWDWQLAVTRLSGKDALAILEENVVDADKEFRYSMNGPEASRLIQLSGAWYAFDRSRPAGSRVVASSLESGRLYSVVFEGHTAHRDSGMLAERLWKQNHHVLDVSLSMALYGHAVRSGRIQARPEGRVRDMTGRNR